MAFKEDSNGYVFFNNQRKRWNAQYGEYDAKTRKIKTKTKSFKTEEEAKKYLATVMYQRENNIYIEQNGIPIYEVMKLNLKIKFDTKQITATQFERVTRTIEKIESTSIGRKNIDKITSNEIQEYMNSIKHLSNSSINKIHQQFNQAFKIAINKGYLMQNPMVNVSKPKSDKEDKTIRALTIEEQELFTEYILKKDINKCKYKNVYLLQMYLGLRCGEALALTNYDIDLKHKKINIYKTLTTDKNSSIIMGNKSKTYSSRRTLLIPDIIYPCIIEQINFANSQENNEEKLLFKPNNARYTRRTNVNSELQRIFKRYFNVSGISTNSLRQTFGIRCIESGISPVVVQKLMGNKDISATLSRYINVLNELKGKEINKVNKNYLDKQLIDNEHFDGIAK